MFVSNIDMENRIERKDDESLYQPKIHSKKIRTLYQLKQAIGKPMTVLVDQAIREFAASYGVECQSGFEEEPIMEKVDTEIWEEICEYRQLLDQLDYQKYLAELEKIKSNGSKMRLLKTMRKMDKEPPKENETWCAYCGKGYKATWDVMTEGGKQSVCNDHKFVLRQIRAVLREKKIEEHVWAIIDPNEEVLEDHQQEDLGDWKNLISYDNL